MNRVLAGKKAQHNGRAFEDRFELVARRAGFAVSRMPDGCRQIGPRKLIRVKSEYDWIISRDAKTILLDTKTNGSKAFGHSDIDPFQVNGIHGTEGLMDHHRKGTRAGYVVELRGVGLVVFIPASVLSERLAAGIPGSIGPQDPGVIILGSADCFDPGILVLP